MRKQTIIHTVIALAGIVTLSASSHTAFAVIEPTKAGATADSTRVVTVIPGDYLDKLAKDNDTTYLRLFYANTEIRNPDVIYPGETVRIPSSTEVLAERALPSAIAPTPASATVAPAQPPVLQPSVTPVPSTPIQAPAAVFTAGTSVWDQLATCESGGNWAINTGNGFYGGLQFTLSSWQAVGGSGYPNQASRSEQINRAQLLQARQGWGAWPACSAKLGLL